MDLRGTVAWAVCAGISLLLVGMVLFGSSGSSSSSSRSSASQTPSSSSVASVDANPANSSDPRLAEVGAALRRISTEDGPGQCTRDMTPAFVSQIYGRTGGDPLTNCIQRNSDSGVETRAVQVYGLSEQGNAAQGSVRVTAGGMAGTTMTVALALDGGHWKLDHLVDLHLNRERLDDIYRRALMSKGLTQAQAQCVVDGIDQNFSDLDMLGFSASGEAKIRAIAAGCVQATSA
jgi:hypothetical protein